MERKKKPGKGKNFKNFQRKGSSRTGTKAEVAKALERKKPEEMRLNKYIAHCGVCSRRQAADLVKAGKVKVNNEVVTEPFVIVKPGDTVQYEGKTIKPEANFVYILMNKPKNVITTTSDEKGRTTVLDILGESITERIFPVGRLDRDTTGLLLISNDGELAQKLTHPSKKVKKIYQVQLDKPVTKNHLMEIAAGIKLEDGIAEVDRVGWLDQTAKDEVLIEIHVGKNRIIRRIFEHLDYGIKKLDRIYYAGLTKKDLPRGKYRFLTEREIIMLRHFS